jgi:hypothetical protein
MMFNLNSGFVFFKLAWQDARHKNDLLKPSIYSLICGLFLTLFGLVSMGLVGLQAGGQPAWLVLTGFCLIVLLFGQFAIARLFSGMTAVLFFAHLTGSRLCMSAAWQALRRRWPELLGLSVASLGTGWLHRPAANRPVSASKTSEIPDLAWTQAVYLLTPVIAIENLSLKEGLSRTSQIVKDRLLRIGADLIGVRAYNLVMSLLLGLVGLGLGLAAAVGLRGLSGGVKVGYALEIFTGVIPFSLCLLLAIVLGSFTSTAYQTCLYLWAANVERARQTNSSIGAALTPPYLAAVLGGAMLS